MDGKVVGVIVCRQQRHKKGAMRGYIAMIAVDKEHRKKNIGVEERSGGLMGREH